MHLAAWYEPLPVFHQELFPDSREPHAGLGPAKSLELLHPCCVVQLGETPLDRLVDQANAIMLPRRVAEEDPGCLKCRERLALQQHVHADSCAVDHTHLRGHD